VICTDCQAATTTLGYSRQYNAPLCKYCTARMIQQLPKIAIRLDMEAVKAARLKILTEAVKCGHSEQEIRELVKSTTMAVQPLQPKVKK